MANLLEWLSTGLKWRIEAFSESFETKKDKVRKDLFISLWGHLPSVEIDAIAPPLNAALKIIYDHICLPPYYLTSLHDDLSPLMRLVRFHEPKIILEIGTAHGNTVANLCQNTNARIYTVNALPEQLSGHLTTFTLTKDEIGSVYRNYGFQSRVTQIYENTLNFDPQKYFSAPCVDFAIIDGCHDTKFVINDFQKILPILNDGAIVLFHDTHPSLTDHLVGSYRACVKIRRKRYDIKHIRNTWWAIWQKRRPGSTAEHR